MALERYIDMFVQNEVGGDFGSYVASYATEHHLVEVHVFERDGKLAVYVTKSSGVPVAEAQRVAHEAVEAHTTGTGYSDAEVVYDGYSLGRSGSL